jgi:hypothetical protein
MYTSCEYKAADGHSTESIEGAATSSHSSSSGGGTAFFILCAKFYTRRFCSHNIPFRRL